MRTREAIREHNEDEDADAECVQLEAESHDVEKEVEVVECEGEAHVDGKFDQVPERKMGQGRSLDGEEVGRWGDGSGREERKGRGLDACRHSTHRGAHMGSRLK